MGLFNFWKKKEKKEFVEPYWVKNGVFMDEEYENVEWRVKEFFYKHFKYDFVDGNHRWMNGDLETGFIIYEAGVIDKQVAENNAANNLWASIVSE